MSVDRFQLPLTITSAARTETAATTTAFMACPLALCQGCMGPEFRWAQALYEMAYQQAQQARREQPRPIFERDLFAVWN